MPLDSVSGHCPACGNLSLVRAYKGELLCTIEECPSPGAAHALLNLPHINAHLVSVHAGSGTIRHPLIERLNDDLFRCTLNMAVFEAIQAFRDNTGVEPDGLYELGQDDSGDVWLLPVQEAPQPS